MENNLLNSGIVMMTQVDLMKIYLILMVYCFYLLLFCWGGGSVILSVYYLTHSAPKLPDATEVVKSLAKSKLPSKSGLNEKIELLQRAEERYYQNNFSNRKVNLKRSVP